MEVFNTRAEHKSRPIRSKVKGVLAYMIPKTILGLLPDNQNYQKVFIATNTKFLIQTI